MAKPGAPKLERWLLRRTEVEALVGLSRSAIYSRLQSGDFPPPVKLGRGAIRWRSDELLAWVDALPKANPGELETEAETETD